MKWRTEREGLIYICQYFVSWYIFLFGSGRPRFGLNTPTLMISVVISPNFCSFLELLLDVHWLFWIYFPCHSYFFLYLLFNIQELIFRAACICSLAWCPPKSEHTNINFKVFFYSLHQLHCFSSSSMYLSLTCYWFLLSVPIIISISVYMEITVFPQ